MKTQHLYALLLAACSLLPVASIAAYDTTVAADGSEVKDTATGLIWRRCSEGQTWSGSTCTGTAATYTHEQALLQAKSQATASGKAWRVPNVKELSSITQLGVSVNPSIDGTAFPATPADWFWSSSPYVGNSGYAWVVYFSYGVVDYYNRYNDNYVRLVR
jgi:Protein of unknown function (DUF1566)